jgi:hypothetical protein
VPRVVVLTALAALGLTAFIDAQPQPNFAVSGGLTRERVIGLLNLSEIVGPECASPDTPASIALFAAPSRSRPAVGTLYLNSPCELAIRIAGGISGEVLPTDESDYERPAAIVYERNGRWYRIARQRGSAWIEHSDAHDFLPYPQILETRLTYLTRQWNGRLWATPGVGAGTPIAPAWMPYVERTISVDVIEQRRVSAETWIRVRLRTETCGQSLTDVTATSGWVRAYQDTGTPTIWFSSRGC